jgi:hypothetical protein
MMMAMHQQMQGMMQQMGGMTQQPASRTRSRSQARAKVDGVLTGCQMWSEVGHGAAEDRASAI